MASRHDSTRAFVQGRVIYVVEDLVFTGLLFVAAFLLFYEVAGYTLQT